MKNDNNYFGIEKQIADLVKKYMIEEQVLYFSFDWESVNKMKQYHPLITTGLLANGISSLDGALNTALLNRHSFISWDYSTLLNNQSYVEMWKKNGLSVDAWIANTLADLQALHDIGVNILTSDYADRLKYIKDINLIELSSVEHKISRKAFVKVYDGINFIG